MVTSIASELGLIIDRAGRIIKESTYEALAVAPINTNSVAMHMDFNWTKMDAMLAKYGPALTFDYHTREAFFVIASARDEDIEAMHQGVPARAGRRLFRSLTPGPRRDAREVPEVQDCPAGLESRVSARVIAEAVLPCEPAQAWFEMQPVATRLRRTSFSWALASLRICADLL